MIEILEHLAGGDCDKDDAAEWLSYYLGKKHDGALTASEALIQKHLRVHFGKRLFITEKIFNADLQRYWGLPI